MFRLYSILYNITSMLDVYVLLPILYGEHWVYMGYTQVSLAQIILLNLAAQVPSEGI